MHVCVVFAVIVRERLDDRLRFLRGGGVIQIGERHSVYRLLQHRKVTPYGLDVPRRIWRGVTPVGNDLYTSSLSCRFRAILATESVAPFMSARVIAARLWRTALLITGQCLCT